MIIKRLWLAGIFSVFFSTGNAWANPSMVCADFGDLTQVLIDWEAYLGAAELSNPAGVLTFGNVGAANGRADILTTPTQVETIFVKNYAGDFIRVTTNVPVTGSTPPIDAIGTTLTKKTPAYRALSKKREYCGTVSLFGVRYRSVYRPITSNGKVIGALYVGNTVSP